MRRLLATTTLALTFVAASACGGKEEPKKDAKAKAADAGKDGAKAKKGDAKKGDAKKGPDKLAKKDGDDAAGGGGAAAAAAGDLSAMVPEGAKMMASMDLKGLVGSALYKQQSAMLESSPFGKNLVAAKACNLGPETWQQAVMGADEAVDDAMMIAMAATGIGKKENIECIAAKYKEQDPKADWKIEDKDGKVVVTLDGGDGMAWAVDDNTIVMAGKAWNAAMQERIGGKGKAAAEGSLKDAMALAGKGHITFAGLATADMAKGPMEGAKFFGGALDLSDGLAVSATMAFADADTAKARTDGFKQQFEGFKGMAGGLGIPQTVVDSVKIEAKDATMAMSLKATPADLDALGKAAAGAMLGGAPQ
ncbi:MAG: hypothetical protein AAGF11_52220 [Myxococcota bacterium]